MISLGQPTEWEKIFVNDMTNKEYLIHIYMCVCMYTYIYIYTHTYIYLSHTIQHQKKTKPGLMAIEFIRISFISRL